MTERKPIISQADREHALDRIRETLHTDQMVRYDVFPEHLLEAVVFSQELVRFAADVIGAGRQREGFLILAVHAHIMSLVPPLYRELTGTV